MMVRRARREPFLSRFMIVTGAVVFAALGGLNGWAWPRRDGWTDAAFGTLVGAVLVVLVAAAVAFPVSGRRQPRLVRTGAGFAAEPVIPPGLQVLMFMGIAALQAGTVTRMWASPYGSDGVALMAITSAMLAAFAVVLAAAIVWAWGVFSVELTSEGVVHRTPFYRRTIPWDALVPGGPAEPYPPAKRIFLVARPELVKQRGLPLFAGTRRDPIVIVDRHAWLVARAIRHYVDEPAHRAEIGTSVEADRLAVALATPQPAPPGPAAPSPYASAAPVRPRLIRAAAILVYVGVAVTVLTAAANLALTFVFQDKLLAAERALAAPPLPGEGDVIFDTNTVAFARGWAIATLAVVVVCGLIAVLLTRAVVRGEDGARIGLAILSGVYGAVSVCPCLVTSSFMGEPKAGAVLNAWSDVNLATGFVAAGFGFTVLILLLNTRAGRLTTNP